MDDKNIIDKLDIFGAEYFHPEFIEIENIEKLKSILYPYPTYLYVQPKYDGWFVVLVKDGNKLYIFTRRRQCKVMELDERLALNIPDDIYIAEWLYGTQWSKQWENGKYYNKFIVFDIYGYNKEYSKIVDMIAMRESGGLFHHPITHGVNIWKNGKEDIDGALKTIKNIFDEYTTPTKTNPIPFEGIVIRHPTKKNLIIKWKKRHTDEYYIVGLVFHKNGTFKSFFVSKNKTETDTKKCLRVHANIPEKIKRQIEQNPKKFIGKIVEIEGKGKFSSGKLRHARFVRLREDLIELNNK